MRQKLWCALGTKQTRPKMAQAPTAPCPLSIADIYFFYELKVVASHAEALRWVEQVHRAKEYNNCGEACGCSDRAMSVAKTELGCHLIRLQSSAPLLRHISLPVQGVVTQPGQSDEPAGRLSRYASEPFFGTQSDFSRLALELGADGGLLYTDAAHVVLCSPREKDLSSIVDSAV